MPVGVGWSSWPSSPTRTLVPAALCDALDVRGDPALDALTRAGCALAPALLVLDNCEHLLDAVRRAWSRRCCARCPGLRVLATSREPLGVAGEAVWPVRPAGAARPGDGARRPARGTTRCGCSPSGPRAGAPGLRRRRAERARRVAGDLRRPGRHAAGDRAGRGPAAGAARWPSIAAGCADRFRLLSRRAAATAPPRHRTLRAAIDWSYDAARPSTSVRLPSGSRSSPAACTLEAAAAVCAGDRGARRATSSTLLGAPGRPVAASWPSAATRARYRLLETMRAVRRRSGWRPAARPSEARRDASRGALPGPGRAGGAGGGGAEPSGAGWTGWRRSTTTCGPRSAGSAGDDDPAELRLAAALARYWRLRGRSRRGPPLADDALSRCRPRDADRARALLSAAFLAHFEGSYATAESYVSQALAAHRERADRPATARCLRLLGSIAAERGDYDRSRAAYAEAMACYEGLDSGLGQADVLQMTGSWPGSAATWMRPNRCWSRPCAATPPCPTPRTLVDQGPPRRGRVYRGDLARARWLAEQALAHFTGSLQGRHRLGAGRRGSGGAARRPPAQGGVGAAGQPRRALGGGHGGGRRACSTRSPPRTSPAANWSTRPACPGSRPRCARARVPVPFVEREARSRTQAALADRMTEQQRYAALVDGAALAVPDVLAAGVGTVHS